MKNNVNVLTIYHIAGCDNWIEVNHETVKNENSLYALKWRMIQSGAKREMTVDEQGDVFEVIKF